MCMQVYACMRVCACFDFLAGVSEVLVGQCTLLVLLGCKCSDGEPQVSLGISDANALNHLL